MAKASPYKICNESQCVNLYIFQRLTNFEFLYELALTVARYYLLNENRRGYDGFTIILYVAVVEHYILIIIIANDSFLCRKHSQFCWF